MVGGMGDEDAGGTWLLTEEGTEVCWEVQEGTTSIDM